MAKGKLILICHYGGEFATNDDGTLSYNGGEANAANVTSETPFNDLKLQLAEVCDVDQKTVTLKYFLPGNKKNLIVVKNDKDVKRMVDFHGDAITAEVFVMGTAGFDRSALEMQSNRESGTKKGETNHDNLHNKKDESAKKRGKVRTKKDDKVPTSPVGKRIRHATAAEREVDSDHKKDGKDESNICVLTNKRSKMSETPTASPGESDAHSNYMNVESDPPSQTERTRPMGRNAARRAGSSSTTPASSDTVSNIAHALSSIVTSNDTLIELLAARQRSIDFKTYMTSHAGLDGLELEVILEEKERLREKWGFRKYY